MRLRGGRPTRRQLLAGAAGFGAAGGLALAAGRLILPGPALPEPPLVRYLSPVAEDSPPEPPHPMFLREGLREQGLVEGRDLRLEVRYAAGRTERLPALATELLELGARILVTAGGTPAFAARQVTDRVPIVMVNGPDPVANGWAVSFARPGRTVTGITGSGPSLAQLGAKQVELLTAIVPRARRLAFLNNSASGSVGPAAAQEAAGLLGLDVLMQDLRDDAEVVPAFERAVAWGADLLMATNVIPMNVPRQRLPDLARRARLPTAGARQYVEAGFLLAYGNVIPAVYRRGAWYVARILAGANPGDLPIEQPSVFELVINRATLAHLGLSLPEHVALQVTEWVG